MAQETKQRTPVHLILSTEIGKSSGMGVLISSPQIRAVPIRIRGRYQNGQQARQLIEHVGNTEENGRLGRNFGTHRPGIVRKHSTNGTVTEKQRLIHKHITTSADVKLE